MSPEAEFVRWLFEVVWSQGQTDSLDEVLGELTFHYGGTAHEMNGNVLRVLVERWREGFPDLRFDVDDLLQQDDRIAVRGRLRGTHLGYWRDIAPTGRSIDFDVAMFFRWDEHRLVEVWEVDDAARRDRQLGLT